MYLLTIILCETEFLKLGLVKSGDSKKENL